MLLTNMIRWTPDTIKPKPIWRSTLSNVTNCDGDKTEFAQSLTGQASCYRTCGLNKYIGSQSHLWFSTDVTMRTSFAYTHTHILACTHTSCPFPSRNHVYLSFFTLKHYCRMERPFHNTIIPLHTNSYSFFTVCENLGVEFVYIKHNYLVRLIHNNSWATVSLISNYSLSHSLLYIARFIAIWS